MFVVGNGIQNEKKKTRRGFMSSECEILISFTKTEIEDLLSNLDQCQSEGYLNYGDPAYTAMKKLQQAM